MFIGHYLNKLTSKNRTALPSRYRKELGGNIIIAKWYEGCLVIVSNKDWQALLNKLTGSVESMTSPVRDTDRFILGSAFELKIDPQGRILIPKLLSDYAELKEDIVFVGLGNRIELWNLMSWNKRCLMIQDTAAELIETISKSK